MVYYREYNYYLGYTIGCFGVCRVFCTTQLYCDDLFFHTVFFSLAKVAPSLVLAIA